MSARNELVGVRETTNQTTINRAFRPTRGCQSAMLGEEPIPLGKRKPVLAASWQTGTKDNRQDAKDAKFRGDFGGAREASNISLPLRAGSLRSCFHPLRKSKKTLALLALLALGGYPHPAFAKGRQA